MVDEIFNLQVKLQYQNEVITLCEVSLHIKSDTRANSAVKWTSEFLSRPIYIIKFFLQTILPSKVKETPSEERGEQQKIIQNETMYEK